MIKLSIGHKVFLTVFLVSLALTAVTLGLVRMSIGQGFADYLARLDSARLERVSDLLRESYREYGNWSFLPASGHEFGGWLRRSFGGRERDGFIPDFPRRPPNPEVVPPGPPGQPPPARPLLPPPDPEFVPFEMRLFARRLAVLDPEGRRIAGSRRADSGGERLELTLDGQLIGYLALYPLEIPFDAPELLFLARQRQNLWLIGLGGLMLSSLGALILARNLLVPIRQLVHAAHRLARGDFRARIEVARSDEFGELARDFNRLAATLEQNEASRRQWIADTSHELRTPVAVLRSHIEAMQDGIRQSDARMLEILHGEVMNMSRLVDDLYQLARADAGQGENRPITVDLAQVLGDAVESFHDRFAAQAIASDWQAPLAGTCLVQGDPERLRQLFINLLENSLRYTDPGGQLDVMCRREHRGIVVQLDDTAPGVPEHALPRLFERFFRLEPSRSRRYGGSGLGLAICKAIVETHGGTIAASASPLGGLRIEVVMPAAGSATP